jgi:ABC-type ATPase with predicted acetyltransferase domain
MVLNLKFITSPPTITKRVMSVAEAFGIGVDSTREFTIFKNLILHYNDTDLIYVSGDSGSGKSCFLRLFCDEQRQRGRKVIDFQTISPSPEDILINSVGSDLDDATRCLSVAGLNEAFIMLRKFKELSEGQKYRYKLAKMVEADADVYIIDEFGATLDREMAKVLAYAFQKWARRTEKQIVVASTHHDLVADFNPDIFIYKGFGEETQIKYLTPEPRAFSLLDEMEIKEATIDDYEKLHQFHYLGQKPAFVRKYYKLTWDSKVIGVIVYCTPFAGSSGRNKVLPQYKGRDNLKKLNAEVVRISRVIIHPKFRGIGIAHIFIRQCNIAIGYRVVEVLAAMPKYNPVFEKAGMTPVSYTEPVDLSV